MFLFGNRLYRDGLIDGIPGQLVDPGTFLVATDKPNQKIPCFFRITRQYGTVTLPQHENTCPDFKIFNQVELKSNSKQSFYRETGHIHTDYQLAEQLSDDKILTYNGSGHQRVWMFPFDRDVSDSSSNSPFLKRLL